MQQLFVTGIGTGIGKTFTSAFLTSYFQADYWKPIQSGDLNQSDSQLVGSLVEDERIIHPERYRLAFAASPHQSAAMENISMCVADFQLPKTVNTLIIEGAGGLYVPINSDEFMIDLIAYLNIPAVLVIQDYLGCINHTLLSITAMRLKGIEIAYAVFNGDFVPKTRAIIEKNLPVETKRINLPYLKELNREKLQMVVAEYKHLKVIV